MKMHTCLQIALFGSFAALAVACGSTAKTQTGGPQSAVTAANASVQQTNRKVVDKDTLQEFENAVQSAKNDTKASIKIFRQAADKDQTFAEAHFNIGVLEEKNGNIEEAKKQYQKAIESRADFPDSYVNLAAILMRENKSDEAEKLLKRVVDEKTGVDPFHAKANLNLGLIYREKGEEIVKKNLGGAEKEFSVSGSDSKEMIQDKQATEYFATAVGYIRRALAGDANNIYCYENLSAIYYMLNNLEVATLVGDQAMQKQKEFNAELQGSLSENLITQDEFDDKFITEKQMSAVYNTYGLIQLAKGEVSGANFWFKKAVDANPDSIDAKLNVAGIAVNVLDFQTAYTMYDEILKKDPDNLEAELSKAVAVRGLNRLDEAEKIYRDILRKKPDYAAAQFNLAILYQEYYRKLPEAKELFATFVAMPSATQTLPKRVEEAQNRMNQIDEIREAEKKAAEENAKLQKEMEAMQQANQ